MDKQIIYYYKRGIASYLIAKKFNVSNSYIRDMLKKHGIKVRGHGITNKMSARKRTPEENRRITEAASSANRGSTHSTIHRARLALSRQKNPKIDETYERPLVNVCKRLSIEVIPQKAFYKYNVDLYFVQENVVVEIFGGGFHNKPDAVKMFNNKIKYLSKKQIPVVIVWADKLTYEPQKIINVIKNLSNDLTIVNGDGTATQRGIGDIIINN